MKIQALYWVGRTWISPDWRDETPDILAFGTVSISTGRIFSAVTFTRNRCGTVKALLRPGCPFGDPALADAIAAAFRKHLVGMALATHLKGAADV